MVFSECQGLAMKAKVLLVLLIVVVVGCCGCQTGGEAVRPIVGITSVYRVSKASGSASTTVNFAYVRAVADNGGVPVVLPTIIDEEIIERYVEELDGLVLIGGADIPPEAYGEQPHETVKVMPDQRYDFDRRLIAKWLDSGKPVLGVCLGMQFSNVVSGGSLIQDIPSQVGTQIKHRGYHNVQIEPGSRLAKILGAEQIRVYSNHHQAVKDLGKGLRIVARSEDGVVEAAERVKGGFGLFVQWHPESTDDLAARRAIYGALVRACRAGN